jgi:hypothetical protein
MYLEMGAPVFVASIATFTGDVCAAHTMERKNAASNNAGAFNMDILIVDCMVRYLPPQKRHTNCCYGSSERTVTDFGSTVSTSLPPFTVA